MEDATSIKAFECLVIYWWSGCKSEATLFKCYSTWIFKWVRPRSCTSGHYPRQGRPWMLNSCTIEMFLNQTSLAWPSPSHKHQWLATNVTSHLPAIYKPCAFHFL